MQIFHKKNIRIGLDIDEVIGGFLEHYSNHIAIDYTKAKNFMFSYKLDAIKTLDKEFWTTMPTKVDGANLSFLPRCYISSRFDLPIEWTQEWLENNHFPCMPVIHVTGSKVQACKDMKLDFFVDDSMSNYMELNSNGINTFLMDCVTNQQYNVGSDRIMKLNNLPKHILDYNKNHAHKRKR